jgi:hypothetical protein
MSAHAVLAPSSAPQWAFCSGSVTANAAVPQFDTQESREGEAAHWVGETVLRAFKVPNGGQHLLCSDLTGMKGPNGVVIDEKMAEGAQIRVDDTLQVCQEHGAVQQLLVEHRVHMPQIHPDNWGTLDTSLHLPAVNTVYIWDYKHGHRQHDAFEHMQLVDYVGGLAAELRLSPDTLLVIRVVQPFCYSSDGPISEWRVTLGELQPYFEQLRVMANEALTDPKFTAGKHCRDCAAVGRCATARRAAYSVITYAKEPYLIETMTGADLAVERKILEIGGVIVKARGKAIDDELTYRINGGAADTGLALQSSFGNLAWTVPPAQAIALASQFGVDIAKPGVDTPTQAKDKVPVTMRPTFEQVLKTVTRRNPTGAKLINADDTIGAQAFKVSK